MADAAELGRRWFELIQAHDVDGALALLADDVDFSYPGGSFHGSGEGRSFLQGYVDGFPDAVFEISTELSSGNRAAFEGTYAGTNTGPMATPQGQMPATGRSVSIPFTTFMETDGEHITAQRAYWDQVAFMAQLGLMPEGPTA